MKYFSVTTVLAPYADFSQVPADRLSYAAERGSRIHACCAAYAQNLWVPDLPDDHLPYFESFTQWFDRYVKKVLWIERELKDDTYMFFGHPDILVQLINGQIIVVDYKTPATEAPTWRAQIAAYCHLAKIKRGMALKLHSAGRAATAIAYSQTTADFAAFLSALNAYRYFKS